MNLLKQIQWLNSLKERLESINKDTLSIKDQGKLSWVIGNLEGVIEMLTKHPHEID